MSAFLEFYVAHPLHAFFLVMWAGLVPIAIADKIGGRK